MSQTNNVNMSVEDSVNESNVPDEQVVKKINMNVLNNIKSILEISTARGTFKASELTAVGKVYDQILELIQ